MPITRKVVKIGDSRGITLPYSWLEFLERQIGKEIVEVAIEVNSVLRILPVVDGKIFVLEVNADTLKKIEEREKQ